MGQPLTKLMKHRKITATFKFCNSGKTEERTVNCLFTDENEQYQMAKIYVVEFQQALVFSKSNNTFLVNN